MSVEIVVYNSKHAKKPKQATIDSAGSNLFAAKTKTLLPHDVIPITLELLLEIADGYFGKTYSRSVILAKHFVSCDAVIDSFYRGVGLVLMTTHSNEPLFIQEGFRIAQLVIHKNGNVAFKQISVEFLEPTQRGSNGFGSTSLQLF